MDLHVGVGLQAAGGVGAGEPVRVGADGRPPAAARPGKAWASARRPARCRRVARPGRGAAARVWRRTGIAPPRAAATRRTASNSAVSASGRAVSWIATTSTSPASMRSARPAGRSTPRRAAWRRPRRAVSPGPVACTAASVLRPVHDDHLVDVRQRAGRGATDQASTGPPGQRQQHLVGGRADPGAGAGREQHHRGPRGVLVVAAGRGHGHAARLPAAEPAAL